MKTFAIASLAVLLTPAILFGESDYPLRTWTDATGRHTVEARFGGLIRDVVSLEREDGKQIKLPLTRLCEADRKYIDDVKAGKVEKVSTALPPAVDDSKTEPHVPGTPRSDAWYRDNEAALVAEIEAIKKGRINPSLQGGPLKHERQDRHGRIRYVFKDNRARDSLRIRKERELSSIRDSRRVTAARAGDLTWKVGAVGVLPNTGNRYSSYRYEVLQVIDRNMMLVECETTYGYEPPHQRSTRLFALCIPTAGYVDDQYLPTSSEVFRSKFEVKDTYTYRTAAGSQKTVLRLEPADEAPSSKPK